PGARHPPRALGPPPAGLGDSVYPTGPTGGVTDDIGVIDSGTLSNTVLFSFAAGDTGLAGITRAKGRWYVHSGPTPIADPFNPNSAMFEFNNLFSNAPTFTTHTSGNPLQRPIGIAYHRGSDRLISINNAPQSDMLPVEFDGIFATSRTNGGDIVTTFDEDVGNPNLPRYRAGTRLVKASGSPDDFFVITVNGGVLNGQGDEGKGSAIYRLTMDNAGNGAVALFADLSFTNFGNITFARGITADANNLYFTDGFTGAIYGISQSDTGDLSTLFQVASGLTRPNDIIFNPYTNKLVFTDNFDQTISQMNLDGSGLEVLVSGVDARGLYIIPTPGAAALLGLGGLAMIRRRR
ncbi:MAG: hypothetical protein IBJ10_11305, partial [Phycisphaerales bacterium]|nr:hypothetical protein [Phycisphaerales bacterium]